jgi:probable blue pigment (indigoidine) exporter
VGSLAAALVGILFGSAFVATAIVLRGFDPIGAVAWRAAVATVLMLPLVAGGGRDRPWVGGNAERRRPMSVAPIATGAADRWVRTIVLAALGGPLFLVCMNVAVARNGATISGFVVGQYAIFAVLIAGPLLGERTPKVTIAALAAALVGTILLADRPGATIDFGGLAFGFIGAVGYALYLVLGRRWSSPYGLRPEVTVLAAVALTALAVGSALAVTFREALQPAAGQLDAIAALIWVAIVLAAGQTLLLASVRRIDARRSATFLLLNPITAAALGAVVLGESLAPSQLAGGVLILVGMTVAVRTA